MRDGTRKLIKIAQQPSRCQFSKRWIVEDARLSLFTQRQYRDFCLSIKSHLSNLPDEIIDIIIEMTNYKYYINQWGILAYVDWSPDTSRYRILDRVLEDDRDFSY